MIYNWTAFHQLFFITYDSYQAGSAFSGHSHGIGGVSWPRWSVLAQITFIRQRGLFYANPWLVLIFPAVITLRAAYFWHMAGNKFITLVSNICTNLSLTDIETGGKAFRASALRGITIEENRFGFEPEISAKLARAHRRIYEKVGISYHGAPTRRGKKSPGAMAFVRSTRS